MLGTNRVILRDGDKIISDTEKVADSFNKFFVNIGKNLKIDKDKQFLAETMYLTLFERQLRNIALILAFLELKIR